MMNEMKKIPLLAFISTEVERCEWLEEQYEALAGIDKAGDLAWL